MPAPSAHGELRPLASDASFFEYMLGREKLAFSSAELIRRFHELSMAVHPDRYATLGPVQQALSVAHAEFLNQAYTTLKDPIRRAKYFLERHGVTEPQEKRVPVELAEAYFELQELLMELASASPEERSAIQKQAGEMRTHLEKTMRALFAKLEQDFKAWDALTAGPDPERVRLMLDMAKILHDHNYARSMWRDLTEKFSV